MFRSVRLCGAVLLVLSLFLPMSKCTTTVDAAGNTDWFHGHPKQDHLDTTILYLVPHKDAGWKQWLLVKPDLNAPYFYIPAFFWPLGVLSLPGTTRLRKWRSLLFWLEFVPLSYAGFVLYAVGWFFRQPLIGAYVGASGVVLSSVTWIAEVTGTLIAIARRRQASRGWPHARP